MIPVIFDVISKGLNIYGMSLVAASVY